MAEKKTDSEILREVHTNVAVLTDRLGSIVPRVNALETHKQRVEKIIYLGLGGGGVLSFIGSLVYIIIKK